MSATAELVAGIDAAVATTAEVDASAATAAAVATAAAETVTTAGADNNQTTDWFSSRVLVQCVSKRVQSLWFCRVDVNLHKEFRPAGPNF
jgi:hypothetical protein